MDAHIRSSNCCIELGLIIPAYGDPASVIRLIHCLSPHLDDLKLNVMAFVVDNGILPSYELPELCTRLDKVELLTPGSNLYYIDSLSYVLRVKNINYSMLLNHDLLLGDNFDLPLLLSRLRRLESQGVSAICSPLVILKSNPCCINASGIVKRGIFYLCRDFGVDRNSILYKKMYPATYLSGTALLAKSDVFRLLLQKLGRWNCLYMEDVALSILAKSENIELLCFTDIQVIHDYQPVWQNRTKLLRYFRGMIRFFIFKFTWL